MFKFALKNMAIKKVQMILIIISIVISAGVGILAYNVANQVNDGITNNAGYYGAIIGPAGSKTQLAMNSMYFTDEPLGTIPYSIVNELKADSRVESAIPYAMADSYNGANLVGTTSEYLEGKELSSGKIFDDSSVFDVVVGYQIAKINELNVGDEIFTSHSAGEQHTQPLKVVGILEKTNTTFDNIVFTQIKTIWEVHEHEEEEEHHEEEHDHEEMANMVCSILVKAKNPGYAMAIVNEYNGKVYNVSDDSYSLQAIEPMDAVRGVIKDVDNTKYIVYVLCAIILAMNIMVISIITLLNMYNSAKEISLMRLIGISMKKINLLYVIENGFIGIISVILAFGVSRLCLLFMSDYVASMGVVLNFGKVYAVEFLILLCVFLISVIPTVICTSLMSKKDSVSN